MKQYINSLLLVVILMICSNKLYATHLAAADIQVTYAGKGADGCSEPEYIYDVILTVYGSCENGPNSTPVGAIQTLWYRSDNAGALGLETQVPMTCIDDPDKRNPVPGGFNGFIVHELCPTFEDSNSCIVVANRDKYPGFKKWIYYAQVTLPVAQTDWKFYWFQGNRNNAIQNLQGAGGTSLYIEAGINNVAQYNVSTPRFTSNPLPYICVNTLTEYLNTPMDIQKKDTTLSLRTTAQMPLTAENAAIGYSAGYDFTNPIASSNGYSVDPITGTAKFRGSVTGFFVLAFRLDKIQKQDNGGEQVIAYTYRDVQVSILNCTKEPPTIDTIPQDLTNATWKPVSKEKDKYRYGIYVCPGSELSFNVRANTPTVGNNVYIRSNNDIIIPASSVTVSGEGTENPVATFKWTPGPGDIGDYTLIFSANDSSCRSDQPIVLRKPAVFQVRVTPGIYAGEDQLYCLNDKAERQLYVSETHNNLLSVMWTNIDGSAATGMDNPQSIAPRVVPPDGVYGLEYRVSTPDLAGACKITDDIKLDADLSNSITIAPSTQTPTVLCKPEYLQLDALFKGQAPLTNPPCGIVKPSSGAVETVKDVAGSLALGKNASYDSLGFATPYFPNATKTSKQQFLISKQDMSAYGMFPGTIRKIGFEVVAAKEPAYLYSNFRIALKCTSKKELSRDTFEKDMTVVYSAPNPITIGLGAQEFELDYPYNWDSSKNLVIQICYSDNATTLPCDPPILRFVPTTYVSRLLYYPLDGNRQPDPAIKDVCGTIIEEIQEHYNRPLFTFKYNIAPAAPILYQWTPGALLSDSTIQTPLAYVAKTQRYVVQSLGGNACKLYDTIDIYVPAHDYHITPADSAICYGTDAILSVNQGHYYKWYEYNNGEYKLATSLDCNTCKTVRAHPLASTHYRVAVYDSVWCIDTVDAWVKVLPRPEVKLLTKDTVIKYGQSIALLATGARQYNWIPSGSLSTPNTSSPVATPAEPTSYVVTGIGANGCRSFDTVKVDIDYRDNIFIPTAFSPNGDGKNDIFRVTNLSFQRIMEFRVFNRWGQEIYASTDLKAGWDGTWKGSDQPIDSYRYIIRVSQPDGLVETYKGDVTLIR